VPELDLGVVLRLRDAIRVEYKRMAWLDSNGGLTPDYPWENAEG
jgi:hypothetical protein